MLGVTRFALEGIGPPGARFDPLRVDLAAPGAATPARTAVLFLENGGGKTVLLRLLFAVVLPGRRSTVGSVKLDGYVGSGDTGHVAIEWASGEHTRLVTGLVLEWRNRTRSGSSANLLALWYSFVPLNGVLDLDCLPTREAGRRLTRAGYRDRLVELSRQHPELQLVVEDSPGAWSDHLLRSTPVDPAAFRYQRQMNADEAEAESLFQGVRNDEDFVRFVVEAIHDPDELEDFAALVGDYAAQLGRRLELERERRFCETSAVALRPLGLAGARRSSAHRALAGARSAAVQLRRRVEAAAALAEEAAAAAAHAATDAQRQSAELERRAARVSELASELRRIEAELRLQAAVEAEQEAADELAAARRDVAAWESVATVVALGELAAQLEQLQAAQAQVSAELEPLRERAVRAATRLAARLVAEAGSLDAAAAAARQRALEAGAASQSLAMAARGQREAAATAIERAAGLRRQVEEVDDQRRLAAAAGELAPGEEPAAASRRAERESEAASREHDACRQHRRAVERRLGEVASRQVQAAGEAARLADQLVARRRELADGEAAARSLVGEERVQQLVPGAEDAWLVLGALEEALTGSVARVAGELRVVAAELDELDSQLDALGAEGLLPPAPELRAVWEAVVAAGIPAATGWSWLARNLDDEGRRAALATNPGVAGGVVVTDPDRLEEARRAVAAAGVETGSVVLIGVAADLERPAPGVAAPVRRALYDPSFTARERERLESEREGLALRRDELLGVLAVDEPLLDRARRLGREHPAARMAAARAEEAELETGRSAAAALASQLRAESDQLEAARAELDDAEPRLATEAARRAELARRASELAKACARAEGLAGEAAGLDAEAARAEEAAERAEREAGEQRDLAERERTVAGQADEAAAAARREIATLAAVLGGSPGGVPGEISAGAVQADEEVPGEPVEALRGAARAARDAYEAERTGRDLTPRLEGLESQLVSLRSQHAALPADVARRAGELATEPGASDPPARHRRLERARADERAAGERARRCAADRGAAEHVLAERTPANRPRHAALAAKDTPSDPLQAARLAEERQREFLALSAQQREQAAAAAQHSEEAKESEAAAKYYRLAVESLPEAGTAAEAAPAAEAAAAAAAPGLSEASGPLPGAAEGAAARSTRFAGSPEAARSAALQAREVLESAQEEWTAADRSFDEAVHAVRAAANAPEVAHLGGVRVALAEEDAQSLAERAEGLAGELETMVASVDSELAEVLRHRDGIVQRLATITDTFLGHLRRLARLSSLPDGLGEWSGRPFLSVDFAVPEPSQLPALLAPVVDDAAGAPSRWAPLQLVMAALRAAVVVRGEGGDRTFSVRMLRPNRMMQLAWAGIGELEREFSGGMKLTAAICTYCTLAALRAETRSSGRLFGVEPGPLFLDNPLGKASADYLLELQHAIATRLGVQLVHTTGVWDVEALATYERVVRLRNLADLRRNVQRLTVDGVPVVLPRGDGGLDATAVSVRPPAQAP